MTSHTDSVVTHTPDSDLIDEPSPANTEAHGYSHTHTYRLISQEVMANPSSSHRLEWAAAAAQQ